MDELSLEEIVYYLLLRRRHHAAALRDQLIVNANAAQGDSKGIKKAIRALEDQIREGDDAPRSTPSGKSTAQVHAGLQALLQHRPK